MLPNEKCPECGSPLRRVGVPANMKETEERRTQTKVVILCTNKECPYYRYE